MLESAAENPESSKRTGMVSPLSLSLSPINIWYLSSNCSGTTFATAVGVSRLIKSTWSKFGLIVLSWGCAGFGVVVGEVLGLLLGELIASSHEFDCVGAVDGM